MHDSECRTLELAAALADAARGGLPAEAAGGPAAWPEVISDLALRHGAARFRVRAAVRSPDGRSGLFDLGRPGCGPARTGRGALIGRASAELPGERELLITIRGRDRTGADAAVEAFEDGNRHGFTAASPAVAEVDGGLVTCRRFHHGLDVSSLASSPVRSALRADVAERGGACDQVFPDRRHIALIGMLRLAEDRREVIVVSPDLLGGLHAVRDPADGIYALTDAAGLGRRMESWAAEGAAVVTVRHSPGKAGLMRRVGGLIDGPTRQQAGVCASRIENGIASTSVRCFDNGRPLPEPMPSALDGILLRHFGPAR